MDMNEQQWLRYIELHRNNTRPVKLDKVLKKRLRKFLKLRAAKLAVKGK